MTKTIKTWLFTHVLVYKWTCTESCSAVAQTGHINPLSQKPYVLISSSAVKYKQSALIIRKLEVNHSESSSRKVYMGEGYKTQNKAVWFWVASLVHTTFHGVNVVCLLTSQFLHRGDTGETGKVWEVPDLPHWVCSELAAWLLISAGRSSFPQEGLSIGPQNVVD